MIVCYYGYVFNILLCLRIGQTNLRIIG